MLRYENDELIVIKVCPRCAKEGRGRGLLSTERRFLNTSPTASWIECRLCGWWGDEHECQDYCFPCDVRQVTVVDIEVLQNLWAFALRKGESAEINPDRIKGRRSPALVFDIRAKDCKDRLMKTDYCSLGHALRTLVARGCLLPGLYKIKL